MLISTWMIAFRNDLGDLNKTKWSDFDLMLQLNTILTTINNELIKCRSTLALKPSVLTLDNTGFSALPSDFVAVESVYDSDNNELLSYATVDVGNSYYRINSLGINVDPGNATINFNYYFMFPQVAITDNMPVPDWMTEYVMKYLTMMVQGQINKTEGTMASMIHSDIIEIVTVRNYSSIDREPPFTIDISPSFGYPQVINWSW